MELLRLDCGKLWAETQLLSREARGPGESSGASETGLQAWSGQVTVKRGAVSGWNHSAHRIDPIFSIVNAKQVR